MDQGSSSGGLCLGALPTLTASRCLQGGFWLLHRGRYTRPHEMLRLQGLRPRRFAKLPDMTQGRFNHAVGNAMSGNVLTRILAKTIDCVHGPFVVYDPWIEPHKAAPRLLF